MIELLIGSAVMLIAVLAALFVYARSNRVSVEQQMVTEVQSDVRSSVFFITLDLRMAGVGLPVEFSGFFLEGVDNEDQGPEVRPDRITMMGNIKDPINIMIDSYQGSAANLSAEDFSSSSTPIRTSSTRARSSSSCPIRLRPAGPARSARSPT